MLFPQAQEPGAVTDLIEAPHRRRVFALECLLQRDGEGVLVVHCADEGHVQFVVGGRRMRQAAVFAGERPQFVDVQAGPDDGTVVFVVDLPDLEAPGGSLTQRRPRGERGQGGGGKPPRRGVRGAGEWLEKAVMLAHGGGLAWVSLGCGVGTTGAGADRLAETEIETGWGLRSLGYK